MPSATKAAPKTSGAKLSIDSRLLDKALNQPAQTDQTIAPVVVMGDAADKPGGKQRVAARSKEDKIIVNLKQSIAIRELLKKDDGNQPADELAAIMATGVGIPVMWCNRFIAAWRWNHDPSGATVEPPRPTFMVEQELPVKHIDGGIGIVAQIFMHADTGKSPQELIEMGYNKNTVYRQYGEWRKKKEAAKQKGGVR